MTPVELTFEQKLEDIKVGSNKYIYEVLRELSDRITKLEKKQPEKVVTEKKEEPTLKVGKK